MDIYKQTTVSSTSVKMTTHLILPACVVVNRIFTHAFI